MFCLVSERKLALLTLLLSLLYSLLNFTVSSAGNKQSVSRRDKVVAENSLSAAFYKFVYNNEKICGDMFGHKGWLPAHKKCRIQCTTGVHICQMQDEAAETSTQRCFLLPDECQARLKQVLSALSLKNSSNSSAGSPPSLRPQPSSRWRNFTSIVPSNHLTPAREPSNEVVGPPSSHSILPPATPVPFPPSQPLDLPPSSLTPPPRNDHLLAPLSTDGVSLPLPEIILSSSTFASLLPTYRTPEKSKQKGFSRRTPQSAAKRPVSPTTSNLEAEDRVDDTLQRNYENMFVEKALPTTIPPSSTVASIDIFDTKSNPFDADISTRELAGVEAAESRSASREEVKSPYSSVAISREGNSFESHNSVISPASQTKQKSQAKVAEQSEEDSGQLHIFGPPYSPAKEKMPAYSALPSSALNKVKEMARKSNGNFPKNNAISVQRAASTVQQQIDLSTELNTKQTRDNPEEPWWNWRQVASKLKGKSFYVQESGVVLDRSIRCCEWAVNGLCDRSWQRIRQLCPKSCGTVVCSSADGALSCNRMIDVDVIDCYEKRRRSKAFGINQSSHNEIIGNSSNETFQVFHPPMNAAYLSSSKESAATKAFSKLVDENSFLKAFAVEDEIKRFNKLNSNQSFKRNV